MYSNLLKVSDAQSRIQWIQQLLACLVLATATVERSFSANEFELTIAAGANDRSESPVVFRVPAELSSAKYLQLVASGREPIPVQWYQRDASLAAFILPRPLKMGDTARFTLLETGVEPKLSVQAQHSNDGKFASLLVHNKEVLRYPLSVRQPPANIEPIFAHSGHIHPLYTPGGKVVTAEFPADHAHQHGIFNAWVNTTFEGRKLDFWNQKAQTAQVEHVRQATSVSGPVFAEFIVEMLHSDLIAPGGIKPVLKDVWTVRAWGVSNGFLLDIETRQTCIASSPLVVEEYHYGGMSFRGREEWLGVAASRFVTSEGKNREAGNHSRPRWVALEGELDGGSCSIAVMGHPSNFRYPEPVRLHPNKPYFVFTPPQLGKFELSPGKEQLARYRYWVTDSMADRDVINRIWEDFAHPPAIQIGR